MKLDKPKIIAFHLPQFHTIPENDKWWGKGFTEWTNVKKASPLFKEHYQPRIPFKNNYYNLLNPKIREWQAKLAKKYGIYGFCYYHYWFKGKKLLEKPLEEILKLKSPDIHFCFSWANESWSRTWYGGKKENLIKQYYGNKQDWKEHFEYLLKFFKDKRYIKVNNKPILLIYKPSLIPQLNFMIKYWNSLAIKEGFSGMHIIETLTGTQSNSSSELSEGIVFYEPGYTLHNTSFYRELLIKIKSRMNSHFKSNYFLNRMNYDRIYKDILKRNLNKFKKKIYLGAFVDYDDTPRRKHLGYLFNGATPEKLKNYLTLLLKKSKEMNSEFLFFTAWNEWGEGAYLEPDKKNKLNFLKAIKNAKKGV